MLFILATLLILGLSALAVIAGIVSYLRDPMAMIRRQQHRDNLAMLSRI